MNTRLVKRPHYTAEQLTGIASRCDWFVCMRQLVCITPTETPRTVFLSAFNGYVGFPYFMTEVLPKITKPIVLVIASEDATFPLGHLDKRHNYYKPYFYLVHALLKNNLVLRIFVENLDTRHIKLTPIPLGLLPHSDWDLYTPLMKGIPIQFDTKKNWAYCCHRNRVGPQWEDRAKVVSFCTDLWSSFTKFEMESSPTDFQHNLLHSKFCICVHGGGVDPSPRAWQALLCGSIPILEHSPIDEAYSRFPVVYVDAWTPDAITPAKLEAWLEELRPFYEDPVKRKEVLRMLSLQYWWDIIQSPLADSILKSPASVE
jgi:hypothetical protein